MLRNSAVYSYFLLYIGLSGETFSAFILPLSYCCYFIFLRHDS
ncbi:hypothetical protein SB48_HM08orf05694 [Heyndrickxia coagulans]|uniref:Uncharacterized protein n=1 Tax=Heyndrickxia coagulans TaxID=1398 RepID=A0AAN0TAP8_HEYCO|nr:hypothetical protein SB48_HM08orf05694 [Heyndrickxia coagulans]